MNTYNKNHTHATWTMDTLMKLEFIAFDLYGDGEVSSDEPEPYVHEPIIIKKYRKYDEYDDK